MIRFFLPLALATAPASAFAEPLIVPTGQTWLFSIDHGQPAHARKVDPAARPGRGEVKVAVRPVFGTMMTIRNNSAQGYTFKAELIGADGKAVTARNCTLPPGNQPALESWPLKALAVRIGDSSPAKGGRC
jgi:hypothetical protein